MKLSKYVFIIGLLLAAFTTASAQEFFESVPFPGGGITTSMVRDSAGVLYVVVHNNGVYRSTDEGYTWESTSLPRWSCGPLRVFGDGTIWLNATHFEGGPESWMVSTDHGETWLTAEELGRSNPGEGRGQILISGKAAVYYDRRKLLISNDFGRTWNLIDMISDQNDCALLDDSTILVSFSDSLLRSDDGGRNWNTVLDDTSYVYLDLGLFDDSVYVHVQRPSDWTFLLLVSDRSMGQWNVLQKVPSLSFEFFRYRGSTWTMYPGGRFSDSWSQIFSFSRIDTSGESVLTELDDIKAYARILRLQGGMLVASDAGILYHDSVSDTWSEQNVGLPPREVLSLFEQQSGLLLAGTAFGGLYCSSDHCATWMSAGLFPEPVAVMQSLPDGKIAAGGSFLRYGEGTLGWLHRRGPLHIGDPANGLWQRMDEGWDGLNDYSVGADGIIFATKPAVIYRSRDMFETADTLKSAGSWCGNTYPFSSVTRVSNDRVYCQLEAGSFVSTDRGDTWENCDYLQAVERISPNCVLKLQRGYLLRSFDDGENWELLPTSLMSNGTLLPAGNGTALLGNRWDGAWQDCWIITDDGDSMQHLVLDPDTYGIVNCALHASDGYLYIGTSRGLFRSRRRMDESAQAHGFSLGQHYPNPASGNITIPFEIRRQGEMRLTIHETTGREAWVVEDGWHAAGTYESVVPVNELRAGVYFIRLEQGGEAAIRKLVVE